MNYGNLIHNFFAFLEARPVIGGLEVSDSSLRFISSGSRFSASVRLPPGVVQAGRIEDPAGFQAALLDLRQQILGPKASKSNRHINIVVTLSSVHIYSQVFTLPYLEGPELEKAVDLNLKMSLPGEAANAYSGWQALKPGGAGQQMEILSAFLERNLADDLVSALRQANFSVLAIESRAMSLARIMKESAGFDPKQPNIILAADSEGLDVVITRGGNLQFDYFNSWAELQGDAKNITLEQFQQMVVRSVNQIMNFYNSHWKEAVGGIFVAATGMQDEIIQTIQKNFSSPVTALNPIFNPPLTPEWFAGMGGALRARMPRKDDRELSLLGIDAREQYFEEQVDHFLDFWRVLIASSLGILLLILGGTWALLKHIDTGVEKQQVLNLSSAASKEIDALKNQAFAFNQHLAMLEKINSAAAPKAPLLGKILEITYRRNVTVTQLNIGVYGEPISLKGKAKSQQDILDFKNELAITPGFQNVNLSLNDIVKSQDAYSFSINFVANPS